MTVKIWKNTMCMWVREEKRGWIIKAFAFKTRAEARAARLTW